MDLILWRHAEAEEGGAGQPDAKRRLTARGDKQAQFGIGLVAARGRIFAVGP